MKENQYPIGKYEPQPYCVEQLKKCLLDIETLPQQMEYAVQNLDAAQLDTPYREGGWTLRQLIHHVADSHMNAYIRFKLGLTEDNPTIKAYEEQIWATMADTYEQPINISLTILHALHKRWISVLKNIKQEEWDRTIVHSATQKQMTLWFLLGMYAWHSRHHLAHITTLKENMGWGSH
jgi:uncharacterized damage-inducible protein DinB